MGCSALRTDCVHFFWGIISPAEELVWITLALVSKDAFAWWQWQSQSFAAQHAGGVSSLYLQQF